MNQKLTTKSNHPRDFKGKTFAFWDLQGFLFYMLQSFAPHQQHQLSVLLSFWLLIFPLKIQFQQAMEMGSSLPCGQQQPKIEEAYSNSIKIWPGRTTTAKYICTQRLVGLARAATNSIAFLASHTRYFKIHMTYNTEHNWSCQGLPCFRMMVLKSPRAQIPSSCNCKQQLPIVHQIENKL